MSGPVAWIRILSQTGSFTDVHSESFTDVHSPYQELYLCYLHITANMTSLDTCLEGIAQRDGLIREGRSSRLGRTGWAGTFPSPFMSRSGSWAAAGRTSAPSRNCRSAISYIDPCPCRSTLGSGQDGIRRGSSGPVLGNGSGNETPRYPQRRVKPGSYTSGECERRDRHGCGQMRTRDGPPTAHNPEVAGSSPTPATW